VQACAERVAETEMLDKENAKLTASLLELQCALTGERERGACLQQFEEHLAAISDYNSKMDIKAARETSGAVAAMHGVHTRCQELCDAVSLNSSRLQNLLITFLRAGTDVLALQDVLAECGRIRQQIEVRRAASLRWAVCVCVCVCVWCVLTQCARQDDGASQLDADGQRAHKRARAELGAGAQPRCWVAVGSEQQ
jgi:hypothetical protein